MIKSENNNLAALRGRFRYAVERRERIESLLQRMSKSPTADEPKANALGDW